MNHGKKRIITVSESVPFQIVIEGLKTNDNSQILAIDDTSFDRGCIVDDSITTLPTGATTSPTTSTQSICSEGFRCPTNSQCIQSEKVCDFIKDCPDGSDEKNCGTCNFEANTCGWRSLPYNVDWIRKTGSSSNPTGPQIDHTIQSSSGSYLLTVRKNGDTDLTGILLGPTFGAIASSCTLSLWAHMGDTGVDNLKVKVDIFLSKAIDLYDEYKYIGSFNGPTGKDWKQYKFTVGEKPAGWLIDMYAFPMYSNFYDKFTDVGIDDVAYENCAVIPPNEAFQCSNGVLINKNQVCNFIKDCLDGSDEKDCGTCDFETNTCGWYDAGYNIQWIRQTGPSTNLLGPQIDHTLLNSFGSYMLTINKNGLSENLAAVLLSKPVGSMSDYCTLSFWVYLGSTDDSLQAFIDMFVSNSENFYDEFEYIGSVRGPLGKNWYQYKFRIGKKPPGWLIDMYAYPLYSSGLNQFTDVALDDIVFENCAVIIPADDETFDCKDGTFINPKKQCNFIKDCSTGLDEINCGDCDFETSSCIWFDDSPGELIWERGQAGSASSTGPSVDHTFGSPNGWYTFVDSRKGDDFDYADLVVDKDLGPSSSTCEIEFYYHMLGNTDDLVLYLAINYHILASYTYLFQYYGDAGNQWNKANVPIGRVSNTFRLIFSAERFMEVDNDIAVDDIKLYNCEFPPGL